MNSVSPPPIDGLAQRLRAPRQDTREAIAFELAALAEELARGRCCCRARHRLCVGQHQRERRGLDDRVEHELALIQALPFDAQAVAERVVARTQLADLVARGRA